MGAIGSILILVGGLVALVGGIMVLIKAFTTSIWWGLAALFIPFVALIFVIIHWAEAKKGFLIYLAGFALIILGIIFGALGGHPQGTAGN